MWLQNKRKIDKRFSCRLYLCSKICGKWIGSCIWAFCIGWNFVFKNEIFVQIRAVKNIPFIFVYWHHLKNQWVTIFCLFMSRLMSFIGWSIKFFSKVICFHWNDGQICCHSWIIFSKKWPIEFDFGPRQFVSICAILNSLHYVYVCDVYFPHSRNLFDWISWNSFYLFVCLSTNMMIGKCTFLWIVHCVFKIRDSTRKIFHRKLSFN